MVVERWLVDILKGRGKVWCAHVHLPGYMNETAELTLPHMNWFSAMSATGKCSLLGSVPLRLRRWSVVQRCMLFAVVNARWTTSNQKLLVLEPKVVVFEPQWIKSTERAKLLLIPPVYSLRGIRADDKLQIVVTEVGQVKQTVTVQNKTVEVITLFIHLFSMESSPNSCLPLNSACLSLCN